MGKVINIATRQTISRQVAAIYPGIRSIQDLSFHACHCGSGLVETATPTAAVYSSEPTGIRWLYNCSACQEPKLVTID